MREGSSIQVESGVQGDAVVLTPRGDVDMSGSPVLRESLKRVIDTRPRRIVVDLADVDYMDSSGVATLVEAMKKVKEMGSRLLICNMKQRVRAIFEIARLDKYFPIVGSLEEAMRA